MRKLIIGLMFVVPLSIANADEDTNIEVLLASLIGTDTGALTSQGEEIKLAYECLKTGEKESGNNKICYYDCSGSKVSRNVSIYEACPASIHKQLDYKLESTVN